MYSIWLSLHYQVTNFCHHCSLNPEKYQSHHYHLQSYLYDIRKQSHSIGKWSTGSKLVMTISISLNFFLVSINDQFNLKENRKVQHDVHRTDPVLQQLHLCVNQVQCPSVWPFLWWFNYFPLNKISISKVKLFRYIFLDIINNVVTYFKYRLTFNQQINLLTFRCQCQFSLCNLQLHFCK